MHETAKGKNAKKVMKSAIYRDREEPHSSPLPHHAAYGSVLRGSADQAGSDPGEQRPSDHHSAPLSSVSDTATQSST